jgi:hypothetical protein
MPLIPETEMRAQTFEKLCLLMAKSLEEGDVHGAKFWAARYRLFADRKYHDALSIALEVKKA